MPKCPRCGEEIYYLNEYRKYEDIYSYKFTVDNNGDCDSELENDDNEGNEPISLKFVCPVCHKQLFDNTDDAMDFLMNKEIVEKGDE